VTASPADPDGVLEGALISEDELRARVVELGAQVSRDYEGLDPLLVAVLKGAVIFAGDLLRAITIPCSIDFMAISSYGSGTESSGVVRILKDLDAPIAGRHVLVVEDIVDSGLTLKYLLKNLAGRKPATLEVAALLRKEGIQQVPLDIRYCGFDIPNEFVVGYGLDFSEKYRNLPYIGTLKPSAYGS
jgi:hypoxanthine phosphoribosyltransferase